MTHVFHSARRVKEKIHPNARPARSESRTDPPPSIRMDRPHRPLGLKPGDQGAILLFQDRVKTSNSFATVWVTVPNRALGRKIGRQAVEAGLAACAQVSGPLESIYRWQGAVESAREWLLVLKTRTRCLKALEALVVAHHPYDTPQFIALPLLGGSTRYLAWLEASARPTTIRPTPRARKPAKPIRQTR